jgi:hypothetical protein
LAVVAFLQNDDTKEILQSEIFENVSDPPPVTGITEVTTLEHIAVYPNPADQEIKIELPSPASQRIRLQIASQVGVVTNIGTIEPGEQSKELTTKDLAGGIYILHMETPSGQIARKKILVVHNK